MHIPNNRKGFTLIELLVVIAIIAILLSIMLPSLKAAKAQAQGIVCNSNIRQLVIANLTYTSDNNEYFVPAAKDLWSGDGGLHRWHGTRTNTDEPFDPSHGPLSSYLGNGQVKECPGIPKFHKGGTWDESFEKGCGGYGYNMAYLGSTLYRKGITTLVEWKAAYAKTTRLTKVKSTSETLIFADTAFPQNNNLIEYSFIEPRYQLSFDGTLNTNSTPIPTMHFRHRSKANIAWVDGHVSVMKIPNKYEGAHIYLESFRIDYSLGMPEPLGNSLFNLK